jgi:regulator of sigma E protease
VEKFSLGFGTKLVGFKKGETEYLISAFPLGGYVKMVGEGGDAELSEEDQARSFAAKHPLQRIAIVAAGPVFNLVFAWFLFVLVYMMGVPAVTSKVGEVPADKPAAKAGIMSGDMVIAVAGKQVSRWDELAREIAESGGKPLDIQVRRAGELLSFKITPEARKSKNLFGETVSSPAIGIVSAGDEVIDRFGPGEAFVRGTQQTWNMIRLTVLSLVKLFERAIPLDTVGGPIMIAKMAGQQASQGGVSFIAFMALLSINLGVLNLLPVPILDGGHLFFFAWEVVFRKPVSQKAREMAQQVGLFLLLSLMVLAFYNDIMRYVLGPG